MLKRQILTASLAALLLVGLSAMPGARSRADEGHDLSHMLVGTWAINFVGPEVSPKGNRFDQPHRHQFTFRDKDGERTVTAKEILDILVPGVWRVTGESFSAAYEFVCPDGVTCGTITMRGGFDSETRISGRYVIFWDTPDSQMSSGYDT